jgi:hypothetical protein
MRKPMVGAVGGTAAAAAAGSREAGGTPAAMAAATMTMTNSMTWTLVPAGCQAG